MKFRYGDTVKVKSGFYEGMEGIVIECTPEPLLGYWYTVKFFIEYEMGGQYIEREILEDCLEKEDE
jgi:hypothetical protein